jgi:hypothetical protein
VAPDFNVNHVYFLYVNHNDQFNRNHSQRGAQSWV